MLMNYTTCQQYTWHDFGWRMLCVIMVFGIIGGTIFTIHGNVIGVVLLVCGVIAAFVYAEFITRGKDYRKYD